MKLVRQLRGDCSLGFSCMYSLNVYSCRGTRVELETAKCFPCAAFLGYFMQLSSAKRAWDELIYIIFSTESNWLGESWLVIPSNYGWEMWLGLVIYMLTVIWHYTEYMFGSLSGGFLDDSGPELRTCAPLLCLLFISPSCLFCHMLVLRVCLSFPFLLSDRPRPQARRWDLNSSLLPPRQSKARCCGICK